MTTSTIVALTGSIGSGKSEAAKVFESLGARIIDADKLSREVVAPGSEGLKRVTHEFGEGVLLPDGSLDREALGKIVFSDQAKRTLLESILHPLINRIFKDRIKALTSESPPPQLIVYVVPLFFESKLSYPEIQKVIVVSAPKEECLNRIMGRDNSNKELAIKKQNSQLPIEVKEKQADFVIMNNSTLEDLRTAVKEVFKKIVK